MNSKMIVAGLGLALLSTSAAYAAGGACNSCIEHEQALKKGPPNGYLASLKDQYKPVIVLITVDRSVTPPVIHWRMAMGGSCGGCGGGKGDHTSSSTGSTRAGAAAASSGHPPDATS
jgi:hypothetical protein